jgi:hypothetical protein
VHIAGRFAEMSKKKDFVEYHLLGMTLCSPLSCTRRFGRMYRLHQLVQQTSEQAGAELILRP